MQFYRIALPFLAVMSLVHAQTDPNSLEIRRKALRDLLAEQWDYRMRHEPEYASILGDKRFNDQLSDFSPKAITDQQAATRDFLKRFEGIDATGFPDQEALNKTLMVRDLKEAIAGERFKNWEMPVTQFSGFHLVAAQLPALLPFDNVKDYRDYIARLHKFPAVFDQLAVLMRLGLQDGLMPPKFLLEKVSLQTHQIGSMSAAASPFAEPLKKFPDSISKEDREAIRNDVLGAIEKDVNPAYLKFEAFVHNDYAPHGRTEPGLWSLPDGAARYAFAVKQSTTTDMTPEEIHQLGLKQVAEIEAEELKIAKKLRFKDLTSFRASINSNPSLRVKSGEEILDLYRKYTDQMYNKLPQLFGRLPKGRMTVVKTEAFREKEAAAAEYQQGTPDGSRPGRVQVNTYEWQKRTTPEIESTAYHEGVPGHHMQIAIAQELPALPQFRQQAYYTAYTEGWALYTERLGKEVGFYQDPYSDYGRLESEMLRAIRLVVDTGVHYKKWSRQQMVDFFHAHSNIAESEVQSETDRYIAWPSQALGYKIGQLTFLDLREKAKKQLGPKFDIRKFHDEVLGGGALPMNVLTDRVDVWIAQEKASGGGVTATKK
jgi:uncharacterized protein (DUF885 family)